MEDAERMVQKVSATMGRKAQKEEQKRLGFVNERTLKAAGQCAPSVLYAVLVTLHRYFTRP